ncbi:MAG: YegP family protein [Flavobacteriales bacterium]|nr:YegP family protein [Flavobacteriales bacterium]
MFQDRRGDFRFRLRAENGETILASGTTRAAAHMGVER